MNARITRRRWSEAEEAKLLALRADGIPYKHCAKVVGHSQQACQTRYWQLTKPDEPPPADEPETDDEVAEVEHGPELPTDLRAIARLLLEAACALEAEADRRGEP